MPENSDRELADNIQAEAINWPDRFFDHDVAAKLIAAYRLAIERAVLEKAAMCVRLMAADGKPRSYEDWENEVLALIPSAGNALAEALAAEYQRGAADGIESVARARTNND